MNKTGIEWTDYTWNPVTGCLHGCKYCYAKRIRDRFNNGDFEPKYHSQRLRQPDKVKNSSMVFVGSMTDMAGDWVQSEWMTGVLSTIDRCDHHTFQFLTKRPDNLKKWFVDYRKNVWLGATVENSGELWRIDALRELKTVPVRYVSFEPLQESIQPDLAGIDWIIIGAQTGPLKLPVKDWVISLINQAQSAGIPVFMKDSLQSMGIHMLQEWPEVL